MGDPGKDFYWICPPLDFVPQPPHFRFCFPDVTSKVPVSRHQPDPDTPKVLLWLDYVPQGHDQDALGRLRGIAAGWSPRL